MFESLDSVKPIKKTKHTEFGGAFGAFFMIISLPLTLYFINLACNKVRFSGRNTQLGINKHRFPS